MGIKNQALWTHLEQRAKQEAPDICSEYLTEVEKICTFGVNRAREIQLIFPMYTLHDETHICNVLRIMAELLGGRLNELTRDETAMLILAASCHDIGMSVSEADKQALVQDDRDRLEEYLEAHPGAYTKAYAKGGDTPELSDALMRDFLRTIHHDRAADLLYTQDWPMVLVGRVDRDDLIRVCQSHGQDISALKEMESANGVDLRLCAVLLRLADILDFDTSRAPRTVYEYCGFDAKDDPEAVISRGEWEKHMGSAGFNFSKVDNRTYPYDLPYAAKCFSMQQEQAVHSYLDWVDAELTNCGKVLKRYAGNWNNLILPDQVKRKITPENYLSGQYRLVLDQSQVLNLLVGENLYSDSAVFVRELLQNAIDAVRTREKMDKNLPRGWKPQINIHTWMDEEGWHWFRIEDNGTGMTEDIIRRHLLTVGNSYYTSDAFRKETLCCDAGEGFIPISRFGIGILSCFMGDKVNNRVEISTKRYKTGDSYPPALRLRMQGLSGYYYLANKQEHHHPGPMVGQDAQEKKEYLTDPGTVVAVRTNLYQSGGYRGFQEIVDKYVVYPPVPIHYVGPEGTKDYFTEEEFMEEVHSIEVLSDQAKEGEFVFRLNEEQLEVIRKDFPDIVFEEQPGIQLKCIDLHRCSSSPYLKGAMVLAKPIGWPDISAITWKGEMVPIDEKYVSIFVSGEDGNLKIQVSFDRKNDDYYTRGIYHQVFSICKLPLLSWCERLFHRVSYWKSVDNIAAHNGIICGRVFERDVFGQPVCSIVLFRDQYCPMVELARDRIRQLPLEADVDLSLIKLQFNRQNYWTGSFIIEPRINNAIEQTAQKYLELAHNRPDFVERLSIPTEKGIISSAQWLEAMEKHSSMALDSTKMSCLWGREFFDCLNDFCLAWLQSVSVLRVRLESNQACVILASAEKPVPIQNRLIDFPPAFFLPPERLECPYLGTSDYYHRLSCNANHPLSRFLIENVHELRKRTPGVFRDIMHSLTYDDAERLIPKINELLSFLRTMPGSPIPVPEGLKLTEEDFCNYDEDE